MRRSSRRRCVRSVEGALVTRTAANGNLVGETSASNRILQSSSFEIEIFITVEHDVHPTPDDRGFPGDEVFEMEAEFCGADVSMEDLSSFLDREGNGVNYSVFYDSDENRYRVVTKMTQEKRKHNVTIEELDDSPHVAATTAHENIFRSAILSDQPTPLDEPFFEEEVHEEPIQCEELVQFDEAVWEAPVQGESVHEEAFKQKVPWETQKIRKSASTDVPRQRTW
ncbi:hypothetical protein QJS10_CPA09g00639 [Acorus calamus]|uniref:Uncharacterized protein n=1 Tax=Acorus calamus TaxID=4465 RepID=A0AAV9E4R6_ACOCL|nr:hypothetical protein QJS10_CPA09g00639 [Acorus calamus]